MYSPKLLNNLITLFAQVGSETLNNVVAVARLNIGVVDTNDESLSGLGSGDSTSTNLAIKDITGVAEDDEVLTTIGELLGGVAGHAGKDSLGLRSGALVVGRLGPLSGVVEAIESSVSNSLLCDTISVGSPRHVEQPH